MIRLHTRNETLGRMVKSALSGEPVGTIAHERLTWSQRPRRADYAVARQSLTKRFERYSASVNAIPVVMPEAQAWLIQALIKRHAEGLDTVVIGLDYIEPNRNGT